MIKCPFCQATHVANTIFCNECGSYLLESDRRPTDPLESDEINWVGGIKDQPRVASSSKPDIRPAAIHLKIGEGKHEVEARLDKTINIGRVDPTSAIFPEVDLTDEGVLSKSVSRRHARILKRENSVLLEDLGSINGTFINGKKLDPYMAEVLSDGDVLQVGKIPIEIKILNR
jgi:pSer/pThr/pTyr-binding forkhead associated (FHA) protein